MNKNTLRAEHALDLEHGRRIAKADTETAENQKLSTEEETMRRAFFAGYDDGSEWLMPDGRNLLHQNRTLAEQKKEWAEWLRQHRKGDHQFKKVW